MMAAWERIEGTGEVCQRCGSDDWCLVSDDGSAIICAREVTDHHPELVGALCLFPSCKFCCGGKPRRIGEAGWLHLISKGSDRRRPHYSRSKITLLDSPKFEQLHANFQADIQSSQFTWWAERLGVSTESLHRLECGWSDQHPVGLSFPLRSPAGEVVGLQVRAINHTKLSIKGSAVSAGLFVPTGISSARQLFICEGASDTAAILTLGLQAIGRTSTGTSCDLVRRIVRHRGFQGLVVVADNDKSGVGQRAAGKLANYLKHFVESVRLLTPPVKDVRAWVRNGASRNDVIGGLTNGT